MVDDFTIALGELATDGGWVFWALIGLAFGIGFSLLSIGYFLRNPNAPHLSQTQWRQLLAQPANNQILLNNLHHNKQLLLLRMELSLVPPLNFK